jgi:hypothetical protein
VKVDRVPRGNFRSLGYGKEKGRKKIEPYRPVVLLI